jgi:hypothetical protein
MRELHVEGAPLLADDPGWVAELRGNPFPRRAHEKVVRVLGLHANGTDPVSAGFAIHAEVGEDCADTVARARPPRRLAGIRPSVSTGPFNEGRIANGRHLNGRGLISWRCWRALVGAPNENNSKKLKTK